MKRAVTPLSLVLVIAACSAKSVPIPQPRPQASDSLQSDTALARIQSDSALARIIDSLGLTVARPVCRMPVLRGDSSRDTRMVLRLPRSEQIPGVPRYSVCHNPLFRAP